MFSKGMQYRPSTLRRLFAHILDGIMLLFIFSPLLLEIFFNWLADGTIHYPLQFFIITYLSSLFYQVIAYGFFGATPGKWLLGLRLVSETGEDVSLVQALVRVLADQLRWFFGWGLFCLALIRFDRRHFSDWMAETKVVQLVPENHFPRRYVFLGLVLCLLISVEGWNSVQERWSHVELRNKQIYFALQ